MEQLSDPRPTNSPRSEWQRAPSLPEVFRSVHVPQEGKGLFGFCRKLLAFSGPGYLVAVGYMDPGNWATSLAGGAQFNYALLPVVILSSFAGTILQYLALKLGIATGRDLAQTCRDHFTPWVNMLLWITCEIAITACDLAEVIGSAIALNLLFGLPLVYGTCLTAIDVLFILSLQNKGFRLIEALVLALILVVGGSFLVEIILSRPDPKQIFSSCLPSMEILKNPNMLYTAVGILGATVMPHNLYLHSAICQTRNFEPTTEGRKQAIFYATLDSTLALICALFINSAILIVSAAVFHKGGYFKVAEIQDAYKLLSPLLGTGVASFFFALALLASGQNSTLTGTLSGQIVMEGFLNLRVHPSLRRLITRLLAILPAVFVAITAGGDTVTRLLVLSQVILSLQLSFVVIPLVLFTSDRDRMRHFVNTSALSFFSWTLAILIVALNGWLLIGTFRTGFGMNPLLLGETPSKESTLTVSRQLSGYLSHDDRN
ncbi:MAG: Nramp family divalent metal transporter [Candidatus Xiphinematobacter sp.]|nr:MAG: Nramp family divalent metal transporter [Candidatus Xiphinematobacter sp.]QQY11738.1 MAG: Nramp family divalent metal transporter [Candidatus Xiphinematobacter sp.]